jgi:catechol 2,3-dioxygenase-like lactoylglutathione lyase family enzyme
MYHPSHHVPDLDEAEEFFARVFGRTSARLSTLSAPASPGKELPDYSTFTLIADVLFDCIDPRRYVLAGEQRYASVEQPTLRGMGWYVEGLGSLFRALRSHGFTVVDQLDRVADGDEPPTAAGSPMPLCFTTPKAAGLRHELLPPIPFPLDPRVQEGWQLAPPSDADPLGIVRCAHHTVLTADLARALRLSVDVFGGTVIARGRDEVLGADTTSVRLADSVLRYAVPDAGSELRAELEATGEDSYHSLTWQVVDLDRVERHLRAEGVGVAARTDTLLVTEPDSSLGIPWGFTA